MREGRSAFRQNKGEVSVPCKLSAGEYFPCLFELARDKRIALVVLLVHYLVQLREIDIRDRKLGVVLSVGAEDGYRLAVVSLCSLAAAERFLTCGAVIE